MLGRRIAARQPPPSCLPELRRALLDECCNIPQEQIDNLILSMPSRCGPNYPVVSDFACVARNHLRRYKLDATGSLLPNKMESMLLIPYDPQGFMEHSLKITALGRGWRIGGMRAIDRAQYFGQATDLKSLPFRSK
ncbi:transposable element Tcb2 transposase [Trichonephila clavipes]|nr:transposable element Tcb2 transposase [Trichonephila clavipes]